MRVLDAVNEWLMGLDDLDCRQMTVLYVVTLFALLYPIYCERWPATRYAALLAVAYALCVPLFLLFGFALAYPVLHHDDRFFKQYGDALDYR
jgi:surface polysaccharide O-acyltransferase-like enzyme